MSLLCCNLFVNAINDKKLSLNYLDIYRTFYISLKSGGCQEIYFCPFCSEKLPRDLSDLYFYILEKEYSIKDVDKAEKNGTLPKEFLTDEWWKKREL